MNEKDNQEAERAAFKEWWGKRVPAGSDSDHAAVFAFEVWQASRRHPAVGEDGLPPLPTSQAYVEVWNCDGKSGASLQSANQPYYTTEQYRQGQREAVAADRLARGSIDGQLTGVPSPVKQGAQQPASAAQGVKCWQNRAHEMDGPHKRLELACHEIEYLRAQIALKSEVPSGFAVVPIEPTKEMAIAGAMASENSHDETQDSYSSYAIWDDTALAYACFKAMLAAAPGKEGT